MKLEHASLSHRLGKLALAATLGFGSGVGTLSSTPAEAQMPKIIVQCIAPLVPNADGTDCVRPAVKATTTCPAILDLQNGRCVEPIKYVKFRNCDTTPHRNYAVAVYPNRVYALFVNGKRQEEPSAWISNYYYHPRFAKGSDGYCAVN
ncbi:hypothetical protein [uncultured Roseibium sp.]|uniref:hypothetical protein n=1 Tax=uncultured Roseibium sp. TaxID=1936171 RepID=UPI0025991378|nr:hypothetical protein [uncultured Roseibium sp.]